jgi:hypothetical protein
MFTVIKSSRAGRVGKAGTTSISARARNTTTNSILRTVTKTGEYNTQRISHNTKAQSQRICHQLFPEPCLYLASHRSQGIFCGLLTRIKMTREHKFSTSTGPIIPKALSLALFHRRPATLSTTHSLPTTVHPGISHPCILRSTMSVTINMSRLLLETDPPS